MTDTTLTDFVEAALRAGASRAEISDALREAGWSEERIEDALAAFADVPFVVPVPRPKARPSARDAFLGLLTFAMLYLVAWNLWTLLALFVDLLVPSGVGDVRGIEYAAGRIRWATATLMVAFPVFLYASRRRLLDVAADPARRISSVRRWLTWLTLFIAATLIVGTLILLLFNLLSGELTLRFIAKGMIATLLATALLGYYRHTLRAEEGEGEGSGQGERVTNVHRLAGWASAAFVTVTVIAGLIVAGSPLERRLQARDEQRLGDLRLLTDAVERYRERNDALPASLPVLLDGRILSRLPLDPSGQAYGYETPSLDRYRLCASFEQASARTAGEDFWAHPGDWHCFDFEAGTRAGVGTTRPVEP